MFNGIINVQLWNTEKSQQITVYKKVEIPFQPSVGMKILAAFTPINLCHVEWILETGQFQATAYIVEGWVGDSFLDVDFYQGEFTKLSWDSTKKYAMNWPWD